MKSEMATVLDISMLPAQARQEVTDFYQFLAQKYGTLTKRRPLPEPGIQQFFRQYQVDMSTYRFNRDEAHESAVKLYSEDLQHGQRIDKLTIINPFG